MVKYRVMHLSIILQTEAFMNLNEKLHGFTVTRIRKIDELDAELIEMSHDKTGSRLAWMNNKEENKLFSIAFKTIPSDDTGVFHILEHSVLCGSDKYPVKEPFLELMKSSMNTFLNAMTFPDKTVFPVSSRNDTDFMNLTKVYLDAVFRPDIYRNPSIFRQEGWHIEMRQESDTPIYKGVVFNEMKGVMDSVNNRIELAVLRALYPDNCYHYESGGDPVSIPDLTYEQFIQHHRTFYHPSNSYIYLDGPVDIDNVLDLIDSEYLSCYDKNDSVHDIPVQAPINNSITKAYYEISAEESEEKKSHYVSSKILADWSEREKIFALQIIAYALTGANESPLKRAVLDTGLCLDVSMDVQDGISQPYGMLHISNTDPESFEKLASLIDEKIREIIDNGIDRKDLSAAINRFEFRFREGEEPQGLERNINALSSWLYGGDPLTYLCADELFESLRNRLDSDYYEKLLAEWMLDKTGTAVIHMLPSKTLGAEERDAENKRILSKVEKMSSEEKAGIIEQNRLLDKWQEEPDSPDALEKLPRLPLSEVSDKPVITKTYVSEEGGIKILRHPAREKGIITASLYFLAADLTPEEIFMADLMCSVLKEMHTSSMSAAEIQRNITSLFGRFGASARIYSPKEDKSVCTPYICLNMRFLKHNADEALVFAAEMLTDLIFDDTAALKKKIRQSYEYNRKSVITSGHSYALMRAKSVNSAEGALNEYLSGFSCVENLRRISDSIEDNAEKILEDMFAVYKKLFCRSRLTVSITSDDEHDFTKLINALPQGEAAACDKFSMKSDTALKQGIIIPSGVSYASLALTGSITERPVWQVLANIVSLDYLWNEVRVKGGAYGAGCLLDVNGTFGFYSYRDPDPCRSVDTYKAAADYIRNFCSDTKDIDQYIISTIAKQESLVSDQSAASSADSLYFRGVTEEELFSRRKTMLSITASDLLSLADKLEKTGSICVIGSDAAIEKCSKHDLTVVSLP